MKRDARQLKELTRRDSGKTLYAATFIFRFENRNSEFEQLNNRIDEVAKSSPSFLGKERWENPEENKLSVIYYWDSLEELKKFSGHPNHQKAKQNYRKWYSGFEIIISEVLEFRSDGGI